MTQFRVHGAYHEGHFKERWWCTCKIGNNHIYGECGPTEIVEVGEQKTILFAQSRIGAKIEALIEECDYDWHHPSKAA